MNEFFIILVALLVIVLIITINRRCEEKEDFDVTKDKECKDALDKVHLEQTSINLVPKKIWNIEWFDYRGTLTFMYGNNQALYLNIRDDATILNTWDDCYKTWGTQQIITQFNNINRPLVFIVIFDATNGFTINYQGENIVTLENKFNITNASGIKVITNNDINITEIK